MVEQFSTDQLVEVSGFSRGALLNYLKLSGAWSKGNEVNIPQAGCG